MECSKSFQLKTFQFLYNTSVHWPILSSNPGFSNSNMLTSFNLTSFNLNTVDLKYLKITFLTSRTWEDLSLSLKVKRFRSSCHVQLPLCSLWPWYTTWKVNSTNRGLEFEKQPLQTMPQLSGISCKACFVFSIFGGDLYFHVLIIEVF